MNGAGCALAAGALIRKLGFVRLRVMGTSMVPAIHPGDLLCIRDVGIREISVGDIVMYPRHGDLIVHRVVQVTAISARDSYVVTRGDRERRSDPPVRLSELLGVVSGLQRACRYRVVGQHPTAIERGLRHILRCSDRATYLYLRISAFWAAWFTKESVCQA